MTSRTVLVTLLVAAISVCATAIAGVPLIHQAATAHARQSLREQANVAATMLAARTGRPAQVQQMARLMRSNGIRLSLVRAHRPDRGWVPPSVMRRLGARKPVHSRVTVNGEEVLIEARPVGRANGVVLAQRVSAARGETVGLRLALALAVGASAGTLAGVLLARRLSRPLRQAARTADRIRQGDRSCLMPLTPPAEVRELSAALNELSAALEVSEQRQKDFLMSVSHELRTPLTTISGYAEALADGVLSTEADTAQDAGRTVLTEAKRLERLVTDLLALARLQADDFAVEQEEVDLTALAAAAVTAWRPSLEGNGTELRAELPPHPVLVRTDPVRLRQVLDILVENAGRVAPQAPLVVALAVAPGGQVALAVRDGGPGLADEDLRVAFERGRLHRRYRDSRPAGTGLGLALAAQLVDRLGGTITAAHAPEGGAAFTIGLARASTGTPSPENP
ncbi:HAMP domain-containing histidine kinase [Streptomyces oryzae]|uniref:Sensor-like histidine kinase SenX3 n=1 Tax=Streptomyces oryzae TaxID=1434886 RepID=A0ABS3XD29_9ACTN|nr:HAMP domain-containing sensor histidine kinase [Streptomyces oryzae]MBO8193302.1 HAMP domain-containing histidine kinase [Streptomyces oryzae]